MQRLFAYLIRRLVRSRTFQRELDKAIAPVMADAPNLKAFRKSYFAYRNRMDV